MSVHAVNGNGYEVRWRTMDRRQRSRSFESAEEAEEFDAAVRSRLALERAQAAWSDVPDRWRRYVVKHQTELL
jgi:hypothetical protein